MNEKQIEFIKSISDDFRDFGVYPCVADFIGCQFALESDFGNSRIAKTRNNYSGMKCPMFRHTLDISQRPNHIAKYRSLVECEIDYMLWFCYNRFNRYDLSKVDMFAKLLKTKGYCPDDDYIEKIQSIYKQFKNSQNE